MSSITKLKLVFSVENHLTFDQHLFKTGYIYMCKFWREAVTATVAILIALDFSAGDQTKDVNADLLKAKVKACGIFVHLFLFSNTAFRDSLTCVWPMCDFPFKSYEHFKNMIFFQYCYWDLGLAQLTSGHLHYIAKKEESALQLFPANQPVQSSVQMKKIILVMLGIFWWWWWWWCWGWHW